MYDTFKHLIKGVSVHVLLYRELVKTNVSLLYKARRDIFSF